MSDFSHVKPGDKKIKARSFNTMMDAARFFQVFQKKWGVSPLKLPTVGAQFCLVVQIGGAAGSDSTTCNFTYDIYERNDTGFVTKLNTDPVTPLNVRLENVEYSAAVTGIFQDFGEDDFDLVVNDENPLPEDCEEGS